METARIKERRAEESRSIFFFRAGAILLAIWGGMFSNSYELLALATLEMGYNYPRGAYWWKNLKVDPKQSIILHVLHWIMPWAMLIGGFIGSGICIALSINFWEESRPLGEYVLVNIPMIVILLKIGEGALVGSSFGLMKIRWKPLFIIWVITMGEGWIHLITGNPMGDNILGFLIGIWALIVGGKNILMVIKKSSPEEPLA